MNSALTRALIRSFYTAQQGLNALPPLPEGLTPQYVHIIDVITQLELDQGSVCVSDVAASVHVSVPGITRSIHALEKLGAVRKVRDDRDRRIVRIAITDLGKNWYDTYVNEYHTKLAALLSDIPEEDMKTTICTVQQVVRKMKDNPITLSDNNTDKQDIPERTGMTGGDMA